MQETCCEYITLVLKKEFQNTSSTLPNYRVSVREAGIYKDYAGTPRRASRSRWGNNFSPTMPSVPQLSVHYSGATY